MRSAASTTRPISRLPATTDIWPRLPPIRGLTSWATGYASRFLAFATEANVEPFLLWVTARVTGEEAVGDVPCWRVEVEAGAPWTFWIAKRRDQPPVQRIRIAQSNGDLVVWEPLDARR